MLTGQILDKTVKVPETPSPDLCATCSSIWKEAHTHTTVLTQPTIQDAIKLLLPGAYIWLGERLICHGPSSAIRLALILVQLSILL